MENELTLMTFITENFYELTLVGLGLAIVAASILAYAWGEERGRKQVFKLHRRQFMNDPRKVK